MKWEFPKIRGTLNASLKGVLKGVLKGIYNGDYCGSFRRLGVPGVGVLIIRIRLFKASQPLRLLHVKHTWVVVKIMAPFWVPLNIRCRIIIRTQKGILILTTTHIGTVVFDLANDASDVKFLEALRFCTSLISKPNDIGRPCPLLSNWPCTLSNIALCSVLS